MAWIAGTDQPQEIFVSCPRCHALRSMSANTDGPLGFFCAGCEWDWTVGAGTTVATTNAGTSAGGTSLPFASGGTGFVQGQWLWYPGATTELVLVTGTPSATSVPVSPLQFAHATAQAVSVVALTLTVSGVGIENVPANPGWGF